MTEVRRPRNGRNDLGGPRLVRTLVRWLWLAASAIAPCGLGCSPASVEGEMHYALIPTFELSHRFFPFGDQRHKALTVSGSYTAYDGQADATVSEGGGPTVNAAGWLSGGVARISFEGAFVHGVDDQYEEGVTLDFGHVSQTFSYWDGMASGETTGGGWLAPDSVMPLSGLFFRYHASETLRLGVQCHLNGGDDAVVAELAVVVDCHLGPAFAIAAGWRYMNVRVKDAESLEDTRFSVSGLTFALKLRL